MNFAKHSYLICISQISLAWFSQKFLRVCPEYPFCSCHLRLSSDCLFLTHSQRSIHTNTKPRPRCGWHETPPLRLDHPARTVRQSRRFVAFCTEGIWATRALFVPYRRGEEAESSEKKRKKIDRKVALMVLVRGGVGQQAWEKDGVDQGARKRRVPTTFDLFLGEILLSVNGKMDERE